VPQAAACATQVRLSHARLTEHALLTTAAHCLLLLLLLQGPREDSGFSSGVDTGIRLASQLYGYIKKYHPKTQLMASGLRTADGEAPWLAIGARGWEHQSYADDSALKGLRIHEMP
jgi:hypothetical protein